MTKKCSNYSTIALISYASKVMLKMLQARLQQYLNQELPDVQSGFRKGRGTRDQIANICWIIEKEGSSRKTSTSDSLTIVKIFDWIMTKWKILKEMRIPDDFVCLLRNLYAGKKAAVRIEHGTSRLVQNWERNTSRLCIVTLLT